ncbi:MAG: hypothetical protein KC413_10660 [Anaerolineales bacterium]|nr:hypothetical protein [Anaerolineales bacterium]MCA9976204.1 hypothetical protein [Anaerolineales bacterium]
MSYNINEEKHYSQATAVVFAAAQGAVAGLQGKVLRESASDGTLEAQFDKKIHGKVLGDRTRFHVQVKEDGAGGTAVIVDGYPIDAVGGKLMFGARKGVTRTVLDWYWAHLEHRLGDAAA